MAKKDKGILVLYVIIFILLAFILSQFILVEKGGITVTTHGVEICNMNYDCGEEDKVCPEDYGATCVIKDPDCK